MEEGEGRKGEWGKSMRGKIKGRKWEAVDRNGEHGRRGEDREYEGRKREGNKGKKRRRREAKGMEKRGREEIQR